MNIVHDTVHDILASQFRLTPILTQTVCFNTFLWGERQTINWIFYLSCRGRSVPSDKASSRWHMQPQYLNCTWIPHLHAYPCTCTHFPEMKGKAVNEHACLLWGSMGCPLCYAPLFFEVSRRWDRMLGTSDRSRAAAWREWQTNGLEAHLFMAPPKVPHHMTISSCWVARPPLIVFQGYLFAIIDLFILVSQ